MKLVRRRGEEREGEQERRGRVQVEGRAGEKEKRSYARQERLLGRTERDVEWRKKIG